MCFDPFEDGHANGYLRNKFGLKDVERLKLVELAIIESEMPRAISYLASLPELNLKSWQDTHRILFSELYPWAGQTRTVDVERGAGAFQILFNRYQKIRADTDAIFRKLQNASLMDNIGEFYSELAFNHPFIDGNGRSLNTIFNEICRRAGFGLDWKNMSRHDYLVALTPAVHRMDYGEIHKFLVSHVIDPPMSDDEMALGLSGIGSPIRGA